MSSDYLDQLAGFVTETRLEDLDASTVSAAKDVVLDTIGAILAGSRLPENVNFAKLAQGMSNGGPSTLLGHTAKVQPVFAALVNGTAGVALEVDEGNRLGGGHASIHVTPGAMAVAEELGGSGKALLESIIVGYEVTSRIGTGTIARPEIHSHGTWGTIGTAAAAARLMGFDRAQTKLAMNLAVSMSPANTWAPCLEGATVRNLYPGRSGFQGIMAAHLGQCGFTALEDAPADLYRTVLGRGFDPGAVVEGLGSGPLRIQQGYIKLHACCLYNHPALDAVQALLNREKFPASEVEFIRVEVPPLALIMADPEPQNTLAAKFSLPFAMASAVVHGNTDVTAFYPDRIADPEVRELARRVNVMGDPEMDLRRYDYPSARVTVQLKNGRQMGDSVIAHYGDQRNPASTQELQDKFRFLTQDTLGEEGAEKVIAAVSSLETMDKAAELTALLVAKGQ